MKKPKWASDHNLEVCGQCHQGFVGVITITALHGHRDNIRSEKVQNKSFCHNMNEDEDDGNSDAENIPTVIS